MKSMTGYARVAVEEDGREIVVELKSVNHRYLDVNTRLPHAFIPFDDLIRKVIASNLSRGHVDVYVSYADRNQNAKQVVLDMPLAENVLEAAKSLKEKFHLKDDFQLNSLMRTGDVLTFEIAEISQDIITGALTNAVESACQQLNEMRRAEGGKLEQVILSRLSAVEALVVKIREFSEEVVANYREKLRQRISEALGSIEIDQARLVNEVAFFADKASIEEELDRLESHISQMKTLLRSEGEGRKMDFLIQEFNREANTICSKSNSVNVTRYGVELKNEIEKIREQIQNIE